MARDITQMPLFLNMALRVGWTAQEAATFAQENQGISSDLGMYRQFTATYLPGWSEKTQVPPAQWQSLTQAQRAAINTRQERVWGKPLPPNQALGSAGKYTRSISRSVANAPFGITPEGVVTTTPEGKYAKRWQQQRGGTTFLIPERLRPVRMALKPGPTSEAKDLAIGIQSVAVLGGEPFGAGGALVEKNLGAWGKRGHYKVPLMEGQKYVTAPSGTIWKPGEKIQWAEGINAPTSAHFFTKLLGTTKVKDRKSVV